MIFMYTACTSVADKCDWSSVTKDRAVVRFRDTAVNTSLASSVIGSKNGYFRRQLLITFENPKEVAKHIGIRAELCQDVIAIQAAIRSEGLLYVYVFLGPGQDWDQIDHTRLADRLDQLNSDYTTKASFPYAVLRALRKIGLKTSGALDFDTIFSDFTPGSARHDAYQNWKTWPAGLAFYPASAENRQAVDALGGTVISAPDGTVSFCQPNPHKGQAIWLLPDTPEIDISACLKHAEALLGPIGIVTIYESMIINSEIIIDGTSDHSERLLNGLAEYYARCQLRTSRIAITRTGIDVHLRPVFDHYLTFYRVTERKQESLENFKNAQNIAKQRFENNRTRALRNFNVLALFFSVVSLNSGLLGLITFISSDPRDSVVTLNIALALVTVSVSGLLFLFGWRALSKR